MTTPETQDNANQTLIGRRTLLKALSAVGLSVLAPLLIPDVWASPTGKRDAATGRLPGGFGGDPEALAISLECDPPVPLFGGSIPEIHDSDLLLGVDEASGILTQYTHRVNIKVNIHAPGRAPDPSSLEMSTGYDATANPSIGDHPGDGRSYRPLFAASASCSAMGFYPNGTGCCPDSGIYLNGTPCTPTIIHKPSPFNSSEAASWAVRTLNRQASVSCPVTGIDPNGAQRTPNIFQSVFNVSGFCNPSMSVASVRLRARTGDPASPYLYSNDATCKIPWTKG